MELAALAERVFAAEDELLGVGCERTFLPWATVYVDRLNPAIYDVNGLRSIRRPPDEASLLAALELAREGGARHHRASARDPDGVEAVRRHLLPRGFQEQRCVAMVLGGRPFHPLTGPLRLSEFDGRDEGRRLAVERCQDEVRREESWYTRDVSRQMDRLAERQLRLGGARFLAAVEPSGEVAGALLSREADGLAFIADVGTVPRWRGRGVASALVAAAAERALARGAAVIGLTARRDDRPRWLYERLGFAVVGEAVDLARPG